MGFSINLCTLLILSLFFFVKKYPYSLDGEDGLMPKMNKFSLFNIILFLLIDFSKILFFSIRWSDEKKINGWVFGISSIKLDVKIAAAVFFFNGYKIIL